MAPCYRRSQATIFLILGIVMLLAIFLIITSNQGYVESNMNKEITKAGETALASNPIKNFVEQCLSLASKDSLIKIGQQSGFLFASQGGTTPDYGSSDEGKLFAFYNGIKVTFLDNNMPSLKKEQGANSIEGQLAAFVENNIDKCLDFSVFEAQGLKIGKKEKVVGAIINEDDVVFSLKYPLTIENPDGGKAEIKEFFSVNEVRLKKIYEFISRYIENGPIADEFSVDVKKDDSGKNDIIVVSDEKSLLDGMPYKYFFAKKPKNDGLSSITGAVVSDGNNIPSADAGLNRTVTLLANALLFGSGKDEDNDQITFKWQLIDKPGGSLTTLSDANIQNPAFVPDTDGSYTFSLRANDGSSFSEASHVTITAKASDPENTKPISLPGQGKNVDAGKETTLAGFGNDADGDSIIYMWMVSKKPSGSKAMLEKPNLQSTVFKPDVRGNYTLKLIVNDGKEDSIPSEVTITASEPGTTRAPAADAGYDKTIKVGAETMLLGNGFDPDNDALTYSWAIASKPSGSTATLSNNNIPNPTFTPNAVGEYKFSLIVDDGQLDSQPSTVTYDAQAVAVNNRPVANAGADRNINVNEKAELHGVGFDKDLESVSYRWSIESMPAGSGLSLSNPNTNNPTFTPDKAGNYVFVSAVNDGKEDSIIDNVILSASATGTNRAPAADAGYDKTIKVGAETMLLGNGFDPDKEQLAFTWAVIAKPSGSQAALLNISAPNPKFTADMAGDYKFNLKAKDAQLTSQQSIVTYTAQSLTGNSKPIANAGPDKNVNLNEEIELQGTGSDADSDLLSYRWSLIASPSSNGASLSNPNTKNPRFTANTIGAYKFLLIVNDGKEDSNSDEAVISVISPSQPCTQGVCDVNAKKWCNNGKFISEGYCNQCGKQDSSCPTCTGNICDVNNKKWCENGLWASGTETQYCSRCGYLDNTCPICESNICDRDNRRWCTNITWSTVSYCQNCGPVDSSCKVVCTNNVCDTKNNKVCKNNIWEDTNYCLQCGNADSSCFSQCTNNACDTKNKKWCNNGIWASADYCTICGSRDLSCGTSCSSNICDTTSNKWCNNAAWESLDYCGHCQDSECLGTCTNNACDINTKQWCNNGIWASADYCTICGSRDSSCAAVCEENVCDTTSNKRCSNGIWTSLNYCDNCALKDSDCTIQCAEGQCDISNKKVCINKQWTNSSYCDFCAAIDKTCPSSCSARKDNVCEKNCSTGADPDCLNISITGNQTEVNITCIDGSECTSGICLAGKCAEPSCSDNVKNGLESDVDCGGNCGKCINDQSCNANSDCASNTCSDGVCVEADTCSDGILDGDEADVDCGGACANKCSIGNNCASDQDCGTDLECVSNLCSKKQAGEEIPAEDIDADNDGIPDEWETKNGLNPNDASDANLDFDDDGLTNIQEYTFGTNPNNADSDGDGTSDKEEIEKDTIPTDPVSKPGGIGGLLIWTIIIIIILGAGSYAIYYYKDYLLAFIRPKEQGPVYQPRAPAQYRPAIVQKKPQKEEENIRETVRERRAEKERKRSKILEAFGGKPKIEDARTMQAHSVGKPIPKEKQKEDVFSELKSISKNKKE